MRRSANRRATRSTLLALPIAAALAGCGSSGSTGTHASFSAKTSTGLSYVLETTVQGKRECASTTIRAALPNGKPGLETSRACGLAPVEHPLLIQAKSSSQSILIDAPAKKCTVVRGGPSHAALRPLVTTCSTAGPLTRATILPATAHLVIVGVTKVPVVNFPRHRCRIICVTALA